MRRVHTAQGFELLSHLKNILEAEGIPCFIKNQNAFISRWAPLVMDMWPELWIANDADYERAKQIVADALSPAPSHGWPWTCPECGERHEPQFTDCWNCGASQPDVS